MRERLGLVGGTVPLEEDLRAVRRWRGERPRVALCTLDSHPIFGSYRTHPPIRYAPSQVAQLDHWVNPRTGEAVVRHYGRSARGRPRPYILETEHWSRLAVEGSPTAEKLLNWELAVANRDLIRRWFGGEECRAIVTYSPGLVAHFKRFLSPEVWPKLTHLYPAFATQADTRPTDREGFTILTVGDRFTDKGIPEALDAYRILRSRHGKAVRMILVSTGTPAGFSLPEGVELYQGRMSEAVKASFYRVADVFLVPNYWDTALAFVEAAAFGVPAVTARIHHDEAFVRHGVTGYLLEAPVFAYSDGYGTRWRSWDEFVADVSRRREAGELRPLVEEATERIEGMISGGVDHPAMGRAARELHRERLTPEVRNEELRRLYASALRG